jgi:hypothetical protein
MLDPLMEPDDPLPLIVPELVPPRVPDEEPEVVPEDPMLPDEPVLPDPMLPDEPVLPEEPMLPEPMLPGELGAVLEPLLLLDWAKTAIGASATTATNAHTSSFFIVDPPDCAFRKAGWSVLAGATLLPPAIHQGKDSPRRRFRAPCERHRGAPTCNPYRTA